MAILTFFERPITLLQTVFCVLLALKVGNLADIGWLLVLIPLAADALVMEMRSTYNTWASRDS